MENPAQHYIIQGLRGYGKTTLLLKLYYEIKNNVTLNNWLVPVIFKEEQNDITMLFKLWENIMFWLNHNTDDFKEDFIELPDLKDPVKYEEKCFAILTDTLKKKNKKLLLLLDNIGELLKKLSKKEEQRLREILITTSCFRIIGASALVMESYFDYGKPFYEFFKVINLNGLNEPETKTLLLNLDKDNPEQTVARIIKTNPGRIEAIRRLSGGVPRTIVMLYDILVKDTNGESFKDLEKIMDNVTPLYKHRTDDLPVQQKAILDAIAKNWDAISVKEIARITRLPSKTISSQLMQLEKNNLIVKVNTSTKNNFYLLKERFYNIWYLMRYGMKHEKYQVKWLVKFIEEWCYKDDLNTLIDKFLIKLKSGNVYDKYAGYLAEAYAQITPSPEKQHQIIAETRKYLELHNSGLAKELSGSDIEIISDIEKHIENKEYQLAVAKLKTIESKTGLIELHLGLIYAEFIKNYKNAEKYYLIAVEKGVELAIFLLAELYHFEYKDYTEAEKFYFMSLEKKEKTVINNLPMLNETEFKIYSKAEMYNLQAIEKRKGDVMYNLALLYKVQFKDTLKAEKYLRMAVEKDDEESKFALAFFYFELNKNKEDAYNLLKDFVSFEDIETPKVSVIICILLWNNKVAEAVNKIKQLITRNDFNDFADTILTLLLAKKQYHFALKLFNNEKTGLKTRFKPIYYALMHFLKEEFPDEYLRMGPELKQTVDEIIEEVNIIAVDYA